MGKKRIGIISLNSGGTMGHMAITTRLLRLFESKDYEACLLSDHDYTNYSNNIKSREYIKLPKNKHLFSQGGNIDYSNKDILKKILDRESFDMIFFSTFLI